MDAICENEPFERIKSKIQFPSKLNRFIIVETRSADRVEVTAPSSSPGQAKTLEAASTRLEHSGPMMLLTIQWQINLSVELFCSHFPVQLNRYLINPMQND